MEIELIELKDIKAVPDIVHIYPQRVKSECTPLVIDNGNSYYMQYILIMFHLIN